ncbi:MAG TPA: 7-carboxy-7-deazaguanine synthase QueE [Kofleriaceae bacterium]|nr:7-carboxy-7-deazaguanine synthase QueE [Kofleriaceae bacterium]
MTEPRRYLVKEMFGPTLQGEGAHAGRPCVFLRFAVCNLSCRWCDTDFAAAGSSHLDSASIVRRLLELDRYGSRLVIVTGGEPALQWDVELATSLRDAGFSVHMESNGTRSLAAVVDWLTISPKPQFHDGRFALASELRPSEVKVVVDDTVDEATLEGYERRWGACLYFAQPCQDAEYARHLARAISLVSQRPRWRLSLQLHKIIGVA